MARLPATGGLYAITDGPRADLVDVVEAALRGGVCMLQYRDASHDRERRLREALALVELADEYDVPVLIEQDVTLAKASDAAGVHLSSLDADPDLARERLDDGAIIGVSCFGDLERARVMAARGADYLSFGVFHASPTRPDAKRVDPDVLRHAATLGPAVVAIGGITPDNGGPLIAAGAHLLASVSAVFGAGDVQAAAQRFSALFPTRTPDS